MPLKYFSRREKQTTFVAIGALRVKFFSIVLIQREITDHTSKTICLDVFLWAIDGPSNPSYRLTEDFCEEMLILCF